MKIKQEHLLFVMIDIQEKFRGAVADFAQIAYSADILNRAADLLQIPLFVTEQYPKGLGHTAKEISLPTNAPIYEKTSFSIFSPEITPLIAATQKQTLVFYGIETHVCVYQSALDALINGYKVIIVADTVASRRSSDRKYALKKLRKCGCQIYTLEMLLFELLGSAEHPHFKEISTLIKGRAL